MLLSSIMPRIVQNEADPDGANSGGGGSEDSGNTGESGESISLEGGNESTNTGNAPEGDGDGGESSGVVGEGTFYEGLERELFTDPSIKPFLNPDGTLDGKKIIKSYVHTKRQFGGNKIAVPSENASEDEWKETLTALGLPDREEYKLNVQKEGVLNDDFLKNFHDKAHEAGILPRQAQQLLNWYEDQVSNLETTSKADYQEAYDAELKNLKNNWGEAFDRNLLMAKKAFSTFADDKLFNDLKSQGLHENLTLIKVFHKIGEGMTEDTFKGESLPSTLSPDEAQREINQAMSDPKGPYLNSEHADHDREVKRIQKLFEIAG